VDATVLSSYKDFFISLLPFVVKAGTSRASVGELHERPGKRRTMAHIANLEIPI
jgi:hypothetical protein